MIAYGIVDLAAVTVLSNCVVQYSENRYLLFLTENDAALNIMQKFLFQNKEAEPYILFGSSFPKDRDYTQVHIRTYVHTL